VTQNPSSPSARFLPPGEIRDECLRCRVKTEKEELDPNLEHTFRNWTPTFPGGRNNYRVDMGRELNGRKKMRDERNLSLSFLLMDYI
jgi:hypothetical protein